jgi:aryl carrier-like protein
VSQLLGVPLDRLDGTASLLNAGLDSLMAVELQNWIQSRFELSLPIASLMRSGSLDSVAESISNELVAGAARAEPEPNAANSAAAGPRMDLTTAYALLDQIPALSEAEVDYWLEQLLAHHSGSDA